MRRILPLGIVIIVTVSIGILLILFASWLGEVLLQIPLQDSVSTFMQNGILLSVAFALLGPLLSERALSSLVQTKTQQSPKVELVPQMDLGIKEPEKKPPKQGMLERLRERLETEEKVKRRETELWERPEPSTRMAELQPNIPTPLAHAVRKGPEIAPVPKPSELSKVEGRPPITTPKPIERPSIEEPSKPSDSKGPPPETSEVQRPTLVPPQRLGVRIDEMSFTCSFCGKTTSLPWVKVEENRKGEQVTVDCQQCHNQYPFNYDLAKGKLLSGKICAV